MISLLDNDAYKLTMQQAVLQLYPRACADYKFIARTPVNFTKEMVDEFKVKIAEMQKLKLTDEEKHFLRYNCTYLQPWYLEYLSTYRFDPIEVGAIYTDGDIKIAVSGDWHRTILWEVPILALVSDIYYKHNGTTIDLNDYYEHTITKGRTLADAGVTHFEFGTRRRRSYPLQLIVVDALKRAKSENGDNKLYGVSNVHLAMHNKLDDKRFPKV